jgi:oxygen-independent coproporphyrinogen-3 oxidase
VAGQERLHRRYVESVCLELQAHPGLADRGPLATVFFGGGTPTELEPEQLGRILAAATGCAPLAPEAEVTVEANPGTSDAAKFAELRGRGVNRLSLGAQSFVDESLALLGRSHSAAQAERAFGAARQAGFDNVSLDLICSIPGAPPAHWRDTLERAVELAPEHLSTYALTVEEDTPFARRRRQGSLPTVPEEEDAWAYEWTQERLARAGYEHYEVSNHALPERRSRHNWGYWAGAEYLGVGVSAHSFLDGQRSWNADEIQPYLEAVEAGRSPTAGEELIDEATAFRERLWMGLRTCEGARLRPEQQRALEGEPRFWELVRAGYVEGHAAGVRLTSRGFLLADALGVELLSLLEQAACDV